MDDNITTVPGTSHLTTKVVNYGKKNQKRLLTTISVLARL